MNASALPIGFAPFHLRQFDPEGRMASCGRFTCPEAAERTRAFLSGTFTEFRYVVVDEGPVLPGLGGGQTYEGAAMARYYPKTLEEKTREIMAARGVDWHQARSILGKRGAAARKARALMRKGKLTPRAIETYAGPRVIGRIELERVGETEQRDETNEPF